MKKTFLFVPCIAFLIVGFAPPTSRAADTPSVTNASSTERTVVITAGDSLRFNLTKITATPGERLKVQLQNVGSIPKASMGHNWILIDSKEAAAAYAKAAMTNKEENYQPKALTAHVLAAISLLGPKEVGEVSFNAPLKPGAYPYFCSFPGHQMAGMHGELVVK